MHVEKSFLFKDGLSQLKVIILEIVHPQYGLFTWPSAVILAQYVWHWRCEWQDKHVIELGCGTALPGVLAAMCGANVILTDGEEFENCLDNARATCKRNGVGRVETAALTWGSFTQTLLEMPCFDIILGSDCFYDTKDFDAILSTVAFLLERNPVGKFWTAYQERSADWSIEHLLRKWNLVCTHVPFSSFSKDFANSDKIGDGISSIQLLVISRHDCERNSCKQNDV